MHLQFLQTKIKMENIKEVFLEGEKIFIKKSLGGWRVIYPIKIDMEKKLTADNINWKNFCYGGLENIFMVLFILFLTGSFFYVYIHDTQELQKVVENPCAYCLTNDMQNILGERLEKFERVDDKNKIYFNFTLNDSLLVTNEK